MSYYRGPQAGYTLAFPPVTPVIKALLIGLAAAFAAQFLIEKLLGMALVQAWLALQPALLFAPPFAVWQLVTYALLHGGLWHLLMNLLGLWMFGGDVERVMGPRRLAGLLFTAVLSGGLAHVAVSLLAGRSVPVVGASAGVLGLVMAFAMYFPERQMFLFPLPVPIPAWVMALIYGALNLYGAIEANPGNRIAHVAHLGGLAGGWVFVLLTRRRRGDPGRFGKKRYPFEVLSGRPRDPFDVN